MQQERPGAPLPFEACENFRELGGYTGCGGRHVKYGAFYRSPALANIKTPADRARFEALGVRTVFDFRSEKERTLAPDPDFPGVVNIPASAMLAEDGSEVDFDLEKLLRSEDGIRMLTEGVHESYARMPFGNPAYRALFGAIRAGQTPILFHCTAGKDSTGVAAALILKALELPGFAEDAPGKEVTVGFGRKTLLDAAPAVLDAVKSGAVRHIFLVGGCDGAKPGRNYYTEFVEKTPQDTLILTLACGKFRFFDKDLGKIGPFPRLLDVGQCNDAYSAVKVALALADALKCGVNDLPLSLVLSWYEQKAVAILLTLLALGVKNIHLGPSLPAFVSPDILNLLVENWGIKPISTPDEDLKTLLG